MNSTLRKMFISVTLLISSCPALASNNPYNYANDPDHEKIKENSISVLKAYTGPAQEQADGFVEGYHNPSKRFDIGADNKAWYAYLNNFCDGVARTLSPESEMARNACIANMNRFRTYYLWSVYLHFSSMDAEPRPDTNFISPK